MDPTTGINTTALPSEWQAWLAIGIVALQLLGRAYHALRNGGGLVGIWRAIMFGTNTPQ
jgi:hypothetical protein